jgi:hypothetical protein
MRSTQRCGRDFSWQSLIPVCLKEAESISDRKSQQMARSPSQHQALAFINQKEIRAAMEIVAKLILAYYP